MISDKSGFTLLRIAPRQAVLIYLLCGLTWILFTKWWIQQDSSPSDAAWCAALSGGIFVIVTGAIVFYFLQVLYFMEERYESLKKYSPNGICSIDINGRLQRANPAFEQLIGHSASDLRQMSTYETVVQASDLPRLRDLFHNTLHKHIYSQTELQLIRKDGAHVNVICTSIPIVVHKKIRGMFLTFEDVTDRKRAEELLLQSEKLSAVGQLAAGIAHEIRNPLTAMKGFLQLLDKTNSKDHMYVDIMTQELNRLELITEELLVLSKPHPANMAEQDVTRIVHNVVTLLQTQAALYNIHITTDFPTRAVPLVCDENRLKQVFMNIGKNAIEAMSNGGHLQFRVKVAETEARIDCCDDGPGIPKETLEHLGTPFYTTKCSGTGLGFMISRKIIEEHNGRIEVASEVGKGTTMTICLPLVNQCVETA